MDSNSRTLTATFCFSAVLVHERRFKLRFGVAELVVKITTSKKLFSAGLEGNTWRRAIDFRAGDKIDETALKGLLREAVAAYNTKHSVPKSKGSRA